MDQSAIVESKAASRIDVVTFKQLFAALRLRAGAIIGVASLVFVAALAFVLVATPRFASETQILLESRETGFTRTLTEQELQGGLFDEQAVVSQVQVISSLDVAREAITRLGLVGNPEFDPLAGPANPIARVRMMLGASRGVYDGAEEDRIFDSYYARLTVFPVEGSRVLAIRFASADPDLAARAANTIAEVYLEQLEEAKADMARAASSWLGTSIEDLRERVSVAEEAVERYRAASGLFMGGNNATITSQQLSDINTELAQARSAQADSQARARLIGDMIAGGRAFEIPDVANNELIQRLIEQRIAMRSQLALEQQTYLSAHPRIRELRAQVSDLDAQIAAAAQQTVRVLENDARLAGARVESLEAALDAQMRIVAQANENEVRLRAFEREARAEREQLEAYLTRYRDAVARGSGNASLPDARVVSRAVVSREPVFPRKVPTVVLATLASIFLAAGAVVVAELAFGSSVPAVKAPARPAARREDGELPPSGGRSNRSSSSRGRTGGNWISRLAQRSKPRESAATLEVEESSRPQQVQLRGTFDEQRREGMPDMDEGILSIGAFHAPAERAVEPAAFTEPEHEVPVPVHPTTVADEVGTPQESASAPEIEVEPRAVAVDEIEAAEEDEARAFVGAGSSARQREDRSRSPEEDVHVEDIAPADAISQEAMATEIPEEPVAEAREPVAEPRAEQGANPAVEQSKGREDQAGGYQSGHDQPGADAVDTKSVGGEAGIRVSEPQVAASMDVPVPPVAPVDQRDEQKLAPEPPRAEPKKKTATEKKAAARKSVPAVAAEPAEERFHFERLVERISEVPVEGRGRRVLITGLGDPARLAALARDFSQEVSRTATAILVETQPHEEREPSVGLSNLIADDASFFHVIQQDVGSRLHYVSVGTADPALFLKEPDALEISFCAFDQTYQWVVLALPDVADADLFALLAKSSDSVVLASDEEPSSAKVLALYEAARKAGASQVLVACVGELANAVAA